MSAISESKPVYQEKPGGFFAKGNPGKPVGAKHMTTILWEAVQKVAKDSGDRHDVEIVRNWIRRAKENPTDLALLMAYIDGKPAQIHTGPDGGAIPFSISHFLGAEEQKALPQESPIDISPQPQAEKP